jgi:hypothetical protein
LIVTIDFIQVGSPAMGKKAPLKRNMGMMKKFMMRLNPSNDAIRDAISNPSEVKANDIRKIIPSTSTTIRGVNFTSTMKDSTRIIEPCIVDWKHPDKVFPTAIEVLDTGATSISLKNPNWRSHITETAENTLVNNTVIPIIPGNRNWA